jgi:hypothetical protein
MISAEICHAFRVIQRYQPGAQAVSDLIMKGMYRIALFAILGTVGFAQTVAFAQTGGSAQTEPPPAEKPPAELERTVLARVNDFYAMMLKHQYRQAEALIAEDTKDYYYGGAKPDVRKYEVLSVAFSDHLTRAKALTKCTEPVVMAGFPPGEMTVTVPSLWKLEDGNWYLYEDPDKITNPSGLRSKIQSAIDGAAAANGLDGPAGMPKEIPKDPSFVLGKLTLDKTEVKLTAGGVEKIIVSNSSSGPVTLEPGYPLAGIEATLDRTELAKGEKATLTLTAGKQPSGGSYYLRAMPTGEAMRINVVVQ